jgi:hypothetical protein
MSTMPEDGGAFTEPRRIREQWFAVLGGALAWGIALGAQYGLVEVACGTGRMLPLHLASAVALLLALTALGVARRVWRAAGRQPADEGGGPLPRSRFMAALGLMASALFAFGIVAQWVGTVFLHPCMAI